MTRKNHIAIYGLLLIAVLANIGVWHSVRHVKSRWLNVPPVPSEAGILAFTLGDKEFAYRFVSLVLQNLGDVGGRSLMLKEYDYAELTRWMYLADKLDPVSDFVPYLASNYFGAVTPAETMRPMIAYLREIGNRPDGQKWRWLGQAVYLARFRMNDMELAKELAYELANNKNPKIPGWARQMPGFVLNAHGEKEAAYAIMVETLKSSADKLSPQEVNYMRVYICTRILDKKQANSNPLCENLPY